MPFLWQDFNIRGNKLGGATVYNERFCFISNITFLLKEWIMLLNPTYSACKLHCYGGRSQLEALSRSNPVVAVALKHGTISDEKSPTYNKHSIGK